MIRHRLLCVALQLCVWAALSGAAFAQNPTAGKTIYDAFCAACHNADPAGNKDNILNGKTSAGINNAFTKYPIDMPYLAQGTFTPAQIADIAAYIASRAPAGTAQFASSPATKNFGNIGIGSASGATTFTLTNGGTVSGTITAISNTNATEFPITGGTCIAVPKAVAAGGSCTIVVTFNPAVIGARSGTIAVNNSGIISPVGITLSGTGQAGGTPGQLSVPGSLGFGTQTVNVQSTASTLTLTNIGGSALTMTSVVSTNALEFPVTVNGCTGSVAAGASCVVSVAFKPSAAGARSGSLAVTSSGVGSPQSVALSGTGQAAVTPGQLSLPGSVNFGTQTVGTPSGQSVTLTNIGGSAVTFSSVSSSNPAEFALSGNSCAGSLGAGTSCSFTVTFTPAAAGARGATILIVSNGTGSPQAIIASGSGQAGATPGQLSVPGAVNFGTQAVGTPIGQNVTLTNIGGGAVTMSSVSSNNLAEFAVVSNSCVGSIGAGAGCSFTVSFTPAASGARAATILVVSTGTGSPQSIAATGTGSAAPPPPGQKVAVIEYYHAAFNHYFVTAIPDEITKLDNGTFVGWARTGKGFNVYVSAAGSTYPVCRFFSTSFALKSSHFYTPNVAECAGLKSNPDWQFEAEVFQMLTSPDGTCPGGTVPVYRLYNDGEGGAPNHRYTTEPQTKALMIGQAWIPEGNGNDAVFMCSPL